MFTLLLLVALVANGVMSQGSGKNSWSAKDFGEMETFLNANNYVYHIEEDLYVPGNILYSEYNVMKTSDGTGTPESIVSGTQYTFGFVQLNSSSVILSMWNFHALKHLNRANKQLDMYIGTGAGYQDGRTTPKFNGPRSIVHRNGILYVADYNNKAIRSVNINSKIVTTVINVNDITYPKALLLSDDGQTLYVSCTNNKIFTIQLGADCGTPAQITHSTSAVFNDPREFVFLSPDMLVVAHDHKLAVFDIRTEEMTDICTGAASYTDGPYDTCTMHTPHGVLLNDSTLYIGQYLRIRTIETPKAVDECKDNLDNCNRHEDCVDTRYSWECPCKTGFERDEGCCADIDECNTTPAKCQSTQNCINTPGSYVCVAK